MPLFLSLAAPGGPCRLPRIAPRLARHLVSTASICTRASLRGYSGAQNHPALAASHCRQHPPSACLTLPRSVSSHAPARWTCRGMRPSHEGLQPSRSYSAGGSDNRVFPEDHMELYMETVGAGEENALGGRMQDEENALGGRMQDAVHHLELHRRFRAQPSRKTRKYQRQSGPGCVLDAVHSSARELYAITPDPKPDSSYTGPRRIELGGLQRRVAEVAPSAVTPDRHSYPASLYSALARYLDHHTALPETGLDFQHTPQELDLLRSKGFDAASVEAWAASLLNPESLAATDIFKPGAEKPPFFLILLYLRRRHIRVFALGVVMRHVGQRVKDESISWTNLKILIIRLLRHARKLWPESIPWIAKLFAAEVTKMHNNEQGAEPIQQHTLSDVTRFCNVFLQLLSLPASVNPMVASFYQEKAQFQVLQFMASRTPAIAVTRRGFRSVTRNQLAHAKTTQEREWAELKGPSWPPWKEDRTAMDEYKEYSFGASRASKILHRTYEAGYSPRTWEKVAEIYAGWDTDLSPTIQTRTLFPQISPKFLTRDYLRHLLWAGRIRTTRTRREAWACFLAHESSGAPAHQEIYMAMFEKLHYPEAKRLSASEAQPDVMEDSEQPADVLLPGDMKEVVTDPTSPLHLVHLSEPIPTYEQLYDRMCSKNVRPAARLLAFLLETYPDFSTVLKMLELAKHDFDGAIEHLITGTHSDNSPIHRIPGYFMAAFICFLCRFGRFLYSPLPTPRLIPPEEHVYHFKLNKHYLLQYAHALLLHYKPRHRPAWTAFMEKVLFTKYDPERQFEHQQGNAMGRGTLQYRILYELIEKMTQTGLDIDDVQFRLICTVTRYAAHATHQGASSIVDAQHIFSTGSPRLRALFHSLVGANADTHSPSPGIESIPPHIPSPADLHAYVRALGILHDYEGLYSFSTWLAKHHVEVTARARAQHSGSKMLFRTLVALRAAMGGWLGKGEHHRRKASNDIVMLVKKQIDSVEEWGGWPSQKYVQLYINKHLRTSTPEVGGR